MTLRHAVESGTCVFRIIFSWIVLPCKSTGYATGKLGVLISIVILICRSILSLIPGVSRIIEEFESEFIDSIIVDVR